MLSRKAIVLVVRPTDPVAVSARSSCGITEQSAGDQGDVFPTTSRALTMKHRSEPSTGAQSTEAAVVPCQGAG